MGCEAGGEVGIGVGVGVAKMHEPVPKTRRKEGGKEGRQEEWNGGARAADDEVTHGPATPVNPEGGKKERMAGEGESGSRPSPRETGQYVTVTPALSSR